MKVDNTLLSYIVSQLLLWFLIGIAIFIPHLDHFFTTNITFACFSVYLVVQFFYYNLCRRDFEIGTHEIQANSSLFYQKQMIPYADISRIAFVERSYFVIAFKFVKILRNDGSIQTIYCNGVFAEDLDSNYDGVTFDSAYYYTKTQFANTFFEESSFWGTKRID